MAPLPSGYRVLPGMALLSFVFVSWFHFFSVHDGSYSQTRAPRPHLLPAVFFRDPDTIELPFTNIVWAKTHVVDEYFIQGALQVYCQWKQKKKHTVPTECAQASQASMLSYQIRGILDQDDRIPKDNVTLEADAFLYNLRHPLDRLLLWYQSEHPKSCNKRVSSCKTRRRIQRNPNGMEALFFKCFPKITQLPLALSMPGRKRLNKTSSCIDLAYKAIQGRIIDEKTFSYMQYNTNYYFTKTIGTYPSKGVLVARTESLWDDLNDIDLRLGGNGTFCLVNKESNDFHDIQNGQRNDTLPLSVGDSALLCCAMQVELHAFRRLLDRAVNLNEASKQATISNAAQRCGFSLWDEMVEYCKSNENIFGMRQISNKNPAKSLLPASPPLSYDNILFCHIGKAGGNTLRVLFKAYCESNRHKIDKECNNAPDSMLSDQVKGFFHSNFMIPKDGAPEAADAFLFNLRHPVDRMMSWYHYEHPKSCLHNTATRIACHSATTIEKEPENKTALFYKTCFPNQHDFAAAFKSNGTSVLERMCINLAHHVVKGNAGQHYGNNGEHIKPIQGFKHITFNMRYYVTRTLANFPDKDVIVVRTESMWDDLKDLDLKLGGYGIFGQREGYKDSHGSETYKQEKDVLSGEEYSTLCCALQEEMDMYRQLVMRAVNLDEEDKYATIANTAERCGFPSWDDMLQQCTIQEHLIDGTRYIDSAVSLSPTLQLNNITFVRVGRAGPDELRVILSEFCRSNLHFFMEECEGAPDSTLGDFVTGYVYAKDALPTRDVIESTDAYLYNLGHPVDHFLSWYSFESPRACVEGHEDRLACKTAQEIQDHPSGNAALFFKKCFSTEDSLSEAFDHQRARVVDKACSKLARKVIDGQVFDIGFKHVSNNIRSYTRRTTDVFPKKKVLVVRTESMWDDLKDLDFQLGGSGSFGPLIGSVVDESEHIRHIDKERISPRDYGVLCCAMMEEMEQYRQLVEVAVNLDKAAKISTITSAVKQCGYSSWNKMVDACSR